MTTSDVTVIGRGAVGLAAAVGLARQGRRVALVAPGGGPGARSMARDADRAGHAESSGADEQPSAAQDWDLRVYALSPASRRLLCALGVWERMPTARIAPVYDMRLFQERAPGVPDDRPVHLDAYRGCVDALAWIVEHRVLMAALEGALAAPELAGRVTSVSASATGLELPPMDRPGGLVTVQLDNGGRLSTGLVVGADGTDSTVRTLAGLKAQIRDLGQTAVVANFDCERSHGDCARQWFGRDGIVALLPLPADDRPSGGRVSLVWSVDHETAAASLAADAASLAERIARLSRGALGLLTPISSMASFPLRSVRMSQTVHPGLVLVGDAAHAVHPMAGQGMNLGFGDVNGLLKVLEASSVVEPSPARIRTPEVVSWLTLRRYARSRREAVLAMQWALDGLGKAYGPLPAPMLALRNLGWSLVGKSTWMQRRLIAHAVS